MHHKWRSYDVWLLRHKAWQTEFFVILGHFLPFNLPNNLKNQNFEKMKKEKMLKDIIILHLHTTNDDHMMYGSWDMERNRKSFLSFWTIFCPLPPNNPENQHFEKWKKIPVDIIILHMCTINENHMMYVSRDMERDRHNLFSFWIIFCPFTQKIKILKKWKKCLEISLLHTSVT